jgi:hypothetical protein
VSERSSNAKIRFAVEYEFDGMKWGTDVWASTLEEAEMKLRAMGGGTILGRMGGTVFAGGKCPTCGHEHEGGLDVSGL